MNYHKKGPKLSGVDRCRRCLTLSRAAEQALQGDLEATAADRDEWRRQAKDAQDSAADAGHRLAAQDVELSTARTRLEAVQARRPWPNQPLSPIPASPRAGPGLGLESENAVKRHATLLTTGRAEESEGS